MVTPTFRSNVATTSSPSRWIDRRGSTCRRPSPCNRHNVNQAATRVAFSFPSSLRHAYGWRGGSTGVYEQVAASLIGASSPKQHLPHSGWDAVQSLPSARAAARSGDQGKAAAPAYRPPRHARLLYGRVFQLRRRGHFERPVVRSSPSSSAELIHCSPASLTWDSWSRRRVFPSLDRL